ncbi:MAG: hypothetical protein AAF604_03365 [Acidobacteriota bacterium]
MRLTVEQSEVLESEWMIFLEEAREMQFYVLVEDIRDLLGRRESKASIQEATLRVLRELLASKKMQVGNLYESGFRVWPGDFNIHVERIRFAWRLLEDWPSIDDVCCFFPAGDDIPMETESDLLPASYSRDGDAGRLPP